MKYTFIKNHEYLFPIEKMCKVLEVVLVAIINGKTNLFQIEQLEKMR